MSNIKLWYSAGDEELKKEEKLNAVIKIFNKLSNRNIDENDESIKKHYMSDKILAMVRSRLENAGFEVETGKKKGQYIKMMSKNNEKEFKPDGYNIEHKILIEVEFGRAYENHQFLKDFMEALIGNEIEIPEKTTINKSKENTLIDYLIIAVPNEYEKHSKPYEKIKSWFEAIYTSDNFKNCKLKVLLIGYDYNKNKNN